MSKPQFTPTTMPETEGRDRAVQRLAEASHRLNEAVKKAIDAGYSVELVRASRHHDGAGNWGDQIIPTVREAGAPAGA